MSEYKQLEATRRERVGKGAARAVRREGRVPAVIYGGGEPPLSIALDYRHAHRLIYAGHFLTTVFQINVEGETVRAIPRDYQLDPIKDLPLHIDFFRLKEGATVNVDIPVHFINQESAPGIKAGGSLNIVSHSIALVVPADAIPDSLTADVGAMEINDSLHVSDIALPEGAVLGAITGDPTIVTISAPQAEEAETAAPAPAAPVDEAKKG